MRRLQLTSLLSVLALASVVSPACSCPGPSPLDAGQADAGMSACPLLEIGPIVLDDQQDVQTIYSAELETNIGLAVPDYLVFNFVNYNERFGPLAIGTFPLDTPPNDNRGPCAECLSVFEDQISVNARPEAVFFQSAGTIRLDEDPRQGLFVGRVTGLELVEVTISDETLESTPVPGGRCFRIDDFDVNFRYVPPSWTCDAALYQSGGDCNCDCGAPDPDCYCDPFRNPNCPPVIEDDCPTGTVCTPEGCATSCDPFSSAGAPCGAGEICGFGFDAPICIDANNRLNAAQLGEVCSGLGIFMEYCAISGTQASGICDDISGLCKPLCGPENPCPDNESCYTVTGGGPQTGYGFCPGNGGGNPPASWTCDPQSYSDGFACDCECGANDPDCVSGELSVLGCEPGETCEADVCQ